MPLKRHYHIPLERLKAIYKPVTDNQARLNEASKELKALRNARLYNFGPRHPLYPHKREQELLAILKEHAQPENPVHGHPMQPGRP